MLTLLYRKIVNNKWMVLCLLLGFLMAVGMMSTVPIYMDASMQRLLIKDMEAFQLDSGSFPGMYNTSKTIIGTPTINEQKEFIENLREMTKTRADRIDIPVGTNKTIIRDNLLYILGSSADASKANYSRAKIVGMTDIENHINITRGRMYNKESFETDGVYEVIVSETVLKVLDINLDNVYEIQPNDAAREPFKVHIVGIYEQSIKNDIYWSETANPYLNALIIDFDVFIKMIEQGILSLTEIYCNYSLLYQDMNMNNVEKVTRDLESDFNFYAENGYDFTFNIYEILLEYCEKSASLTRMLWVIEIPTLIMLAFYLFMVSRLSIEKEKNEIAVLKSRGATGGQVFGLYAMQTGIIGVITFFVAPFIGLFLCRFLGVSNGFLEFVNRHGISAKLSSTAFLYSFIAVIIFFVATMIPVISASKMTIVGYKQSKTKVVKIAFWEKLFIDVILIIISGVFLYFFVRFYNKSISEGTFVATGIVNPLFFIFSASLIMGLGLLFIRIYPYLLRLVYFAAKPFWSPSQYIAVTSVCRSQGGRERFLMLFLVVTFSFGLFYANTARAVNNNIEDKIHYQNGADMIIKEYWLEGSGDTENVSMNYDETDFDNYLHLTGVENATKVYRNESARVSISGNTAEQVSMMAIEPSKFADVSWFRSDLLPVHYYNYCNALVDYNSGILVSKSLADKLGIILGDEIEVKWSGYEKIPLTVLSIIEYWPGINPNDINRKGEQKDFIVVNYNYTLSMTSLEPYEIWLKLSKTASSEEIYNDIKEKRLLVEKIEDSKQQIIAEKTKPTLQGMNGALTLGFIVVMIMTVIGYLIYWIMSIKERTLQFGILRAMGMSFREIIGVLVYEQLFVSVASIAAAFIIGGVTSDLYVPLFQTMYDIKDQIPPFLVSALRSDYIKIYALIVIMLTVGFIILGGIIKKININKALKLGED